MIQKYSPVIIVGAPRSGTNMLRDILCKLDLVKTWPCDEINYIWRYGNASYPSDEIPVEKATPSVKKYIRKCFDNIHKKSSAKIILEKTCANSLRVPFVDEVIPEAKYIFIYRNGIDVVGSARLRWKASLNLSYILKKARYIPKLDLPYYAVRYLWARIYRLFSKQKRVAFWGPCIDDMESILKKYSLEEICGLQWKQCVESSEEAFSKMSPEKVIRLKYESFVQNPKDEMKRILTFLKLQYSQEDLENIIKDVSVSSLNKGRRSLGNVQVKKLENLLSDTLRQYGYI